MLVLNKVLNESVSEFIIQMFKPQWSPTENQAHLLTNSNGSLTSINAPVTVTDKERRKYSAFRLPFYAPGNRPISFPKEGPFHNQNYIFGGAIVNTHFINLLDTINTALKTGAIPESISIKTETYDPAIGIEDLVTVTLDPQGVLTIGEFTNSSYALVKNFENAFMGIGQTTSAYIDSQNVPELLADRKSVV